MWSSLPTCVYRPGWPSSSWKTLAKEVDAPFLPVRRKAKKPVALLKRPMRLSSAAVSMDGGLIFIDTGLVVWRLTRDMMEENRRRMRRKPACNPSFVVGTPHDTVRTLPTRPRPSNEAAV